MDAISLLTSDHKTVEQLFKRFERAGHGAHKTKEKLVHQMIEALSKHAVIEEALLYPAARQAAKDKDELVLESLEEHHVVKWTLDELQKMKPADERYDAKVSVLMESVRHHVEEEEGDLFPRLKKAMSRDQLENLGEQLDKLKQVAPTRPHPRSPDQPPGNLLSTPVASMMDMGRDMVRKGLETAKEKARSRQGVIARFAKSRRGEGAGQRKGR